EKSSGTLSSAELSVVCDGKLVARESRPLPARLELKYKPAAARGYCRAYVRQTNSLAAVNPIFYARSGK
nr:hypothetical protein [Elusimicrobiales bacterium]